MNIVKAPTDPEKQRPYFYIIKDKEIFSSPSDDGRGVSFLYQSGGRLISSAKITGNVQDEKILKMLESTDGFKKLVHSIGVSVEMNDPSSEVDFDFQMYGKKDLYGGGANIEAQLKADMSEKRIYMSDVDWKADDDIPGQVRVYLPKPEEKAHLNVRLYLNDGFDAPPQTEEQKVDVESAGYVDMIKKSLVQTGNVRRLHKLKSKAARGEEVTIAYIGGSITQGAGATPINTECYAYKSFKKIKELLGNGDNVHYVKAGVGGTPSELGMLRFERDVLRDGSVEPDLVIVEFAVNDDGDETKGKCYESLVRKILKQPNEPAVILLFSVFADDYNLQDRLMPVGERYDLPMVSVKNAVVEQFYAGDKKIISKHQYFYDMFHPTNLGHTVMADCIVNLIKEAFKAEAVDEERGLEGEPAIGSDFEDVFLIDKKDNTEFAKIDEGGFTLQDTVLQSVEMNEDIETTPEFPYNWMYDGKKCKHESFKMEINCSKLLVIMKDSGEVDAAAAKVYVDGKFVRDLDPYVNRWCHCNPLIVIDEKCTGSHVVEIVPDEDEVRDKFTILGFGVVR